MTTNEIRSAPQAVAIIVAVACGCLQALQARLNGTLSAHGHPTIMAALWSFGSGLAVLTALLLLRPAVRRGVAATLDGVRSGRLAWWQCIGGALGGLYVGAQTYSVPLIGVAIFTVSMIAGQTVAALAVDRLGISPSGKQAISLMRVAAALLAIVGVAVSAAGRTGGTSFSMLALVFAVLVGGSQALQQALNAHVNLVSKQTMATTWQNFVFGCIVLAAIAVGIAVGSSQAWQFPSGAPWWAWFGGIAGILFIAGAAWAVHAIGVLIFGLVAVAGQLGTAMLLDILDPSTRGEVGPGLVAGVLITLAAAVVAGVAAARR